jgi:hypothetical protein
MSQSNTNNLPRYTERTVSDFKSRLVGGGARPNLFECEINFPAGLGITADDDFRFLVKAASLPASSINVIDIPFRGRNLKIAGDRTFDPWSITVINDTNFKIRDAFEKWMNYMNRHDDNAGVITPVAYQTDMKVHQLGRGYTASSSSNGALPAPSDTIPVLKSYKFYGTFPTAISAIELSYDSADSIEEFTVDLQVQWYDSLNGSTQDSILGNPLGETF